MNINDLLDSCEKAYFENDYKRLIELCDEVLKTDSDNQTAIAYKSAGFFFLNQAENALEILEKAVELYPDNYYLKNNLAMAYYDLGEYEKSLECCEEGLEIKRFYPLYQNKIRALLKLGLIDEAVECYENSPLLVDIIDLMIEAEKYREAFNYCLNEDLDDFNEIIDKIKQKNTGVLGDYYMSWIYKIKSKSDIRTCPDCGGELIPIVWGYPDRKVLKKAECGEVFLGGCTIGINPSNYHCKSCDKDFDMGCEGLKIECGDGRLADYTEYKIRQFTSKLKADSVVFIKSLDSLKSELKGFQDEEFDAFITHLKDLDYIYEPSEGYIKLVGFDDWECVKQYPEI